MAAVCDSTTPSIMNFGPGGKPVARVFPARIFDGGEILRPESGRVLKVGDVETQGQFAVPQQFVVELQLLKVATGAVHARQAVFVGPVDSCTKRAQLFAPRRQGD